MLKAPAGRGAPLRPVVVYDGACEFCRRWIGRLRRWDTHGAIDYMPLQDPGAPGLTGRTVEELEEAMCLVRPDRTVFSGAEAARELLSYLRHAWIPGALFRLPGVMPVADRLYRWVAARRHRTGCGGEHCRLS